MSEAETIQDAELALQQAIQDYANVCCGPGVVRNWAVEIERFDGERALFSVHCSPQMSWLELAGWAEFSFMTLRRAATAALLAGE